MNVASLLRRRALTPPLGRFREQRAREDGGASMGASAADEIGATIAQRRGSRRGRGAAAAERDQQG
jgi:hypothetical protein